jgi:hypothetical protein
MDKALANGAPVLWGARAIWKRGEHPQLLPDRQNIVCAPGVGAEEKEKLISAMISLINDNGYLAQAWKNIPSHVDGSDATHLVLLDNDDVLIEASPLSSYGYLYVCASPKPGRISLDQGKVGGP